MKVTKMETVRSLFADNPQITPKELASKMNIKEPYAYTLLWKVKSPQKPKVKAKKKLGRPKKVVLTQADLLYAKSLGRAHRERMKTGIETIMTATSNKPIRDMVNHPAHYKVGGIETIDFIEAKKLSYNLGNVVKYITRADHKGSKRLDLEKAQWYLNRELENLSKK